MNNKIINTTSVKLIGALKVSIMLGISMLSLSVVSEELSLSNIFSDHMVLQREQPVKIWGSGTPGEEVELIFRGDHFDTQTDKKGQWEIILPPMKAGGPFEMHVKSGSATQTLKDIFLGEVWLAAGQSNMAFRFKFSDDKDKPGAFLAIDDTNVRMYEVAKIVSGGKLLNAEDTPWTVADKTIIDEWSAVAVYFSQALALEKGVAIGIINCSQGSSTIEAWMSASAIADAKAAGYVPMEEFEDIRRYYRNPSVLHQSMLSQVIPYGIRGVLWYQGESNAKDAASYEILLPAMIRSWREMWGQKELPFLFAQLPAYEPPDESTENSWALFRAAQAEVDKTVPNTGMAVLIDVGEKDNIHPKNKKTVGDRLASLARARVYGENIAYSGPSIKKIEYRGKTATISFHHAEDGLVVRGVTPQGFSVKSSGGDWYQAEARVSKGQIIVGHPEVPEVTGVRYGWANAPGVNLYNKKGYPAVPFRVEE